LTQEGSIITDEMKALIGVEGTPTVFEVEKGAIKLFAEAIDDPNPLWQDEDYAKKTEYGGIIAPPIFLCSPRTGMAQGVERKTPFTRLLAGGDELEYFKPVKPGDTITAVGKIAEYSEREGKRGKMLFIIIETTFRNQRDEVVVIGSSTYIYY